MAELFKNKNRDLNQEIFNDIFNVTEINNYECLYLLSTVNEEKQMLEEFNKTLLNKNKMIFIASSLDNYDQNDQYFKELKKYFKKYKIKEFILIDSRVSKFATIQHLRNSDIIFLMGGNPVLQLEFIKGYEISTLLEDYKGIIIGMSAGAINLAERSYISRDEDFDNSFFYEGLRLTNITVNPHFDFNNKKQKKDLLELDNIVGLPDNSFIKVNKFGEVTYFGEYYIKENNKIRKEG